MQEVRCRHCGAIFTPHHQGAVCPFCGAEPGTRFDTMVSFISKYWIILLFAIPLLVIYPPSREAWMWIAFLGMMGALGFAWFFFERAKGSKKDERPISLGLEPPPAKVRPDPWSAPLSPPKVPDRWRTLVDSRPPRDVYVPNKLWIGFLVESFTVLSVLYGYYAAANRHHAPILRFLSSHQDPFAVVTSIAYLVSWVNRLKSMLTTRDIMRDGEVTIAYTTERHWNRATYQFWTKSGERFERKTSVLKRPDLPTDTSLVPVFYMPEDPRKSVALYGTEFRVRLPEDATARQFQKAPVRT
jgi:rubredoxin